MDGDLSAIPLKLKWILLRKTARKQIFKVVASDWIDYLHIAKFNGRWVIVKVLWELKPPKK